MFVESMSLQRNLMQLNCLLWSKKSTTPHNGFQTVYHVLCTKLNFKGKDKSTKISYRLKPCGAVINPLLSGN